jgi:regulator of ribosome biosynthesis
MTTMAEPKPQPYTFDLGHLLCNDPNPLPSVKGVDDKQKEAILASTAQGCAQALINQLLTSCPISKASDDGSLQIKLPAPETALPREKPVPKEKEKSKWAKFAEKKGIQKKRKDGKLVYNEAKGDWVPKYGYKGKNVDGDGDWLVEVDEKAEAASKDARQGGRKKSKGR